jgi:ribosomal protein S18 acetylase RimI-like enzyme
VVLVLTCLYGSPERHEKNFDLFKWGYELSLEIQLRRCTKSDADSLTLIGQATFLETFAGVLAGRDIIKHCASAHSAELYSTWLDDLEYQLWVAEVEPGQAPIGFMVVAPAQLPLPDISSTDLEIKRIYILSKFHGGGIGKRFLTEATRHARELQAERLLLGVYAKNASAIGFYESSGFRKIGRRKFNVGGQDYDDHIMGKSLS